jgi:hypothetical protein
MATIASGITFSPWVMTVVGVGEYVPIRPFIRFPSFMILPCSLVRHRFSVADRLSLGHG